MITNQEIFMFTMIFTSNMHILHIFSKDLLTIIPTFNTLTFMQKNMWQNFFVSLLFTIAVSYFSFNYLINNNISKFNNFDDKQVHIIIFGISYFLYDLVYNNILEKKNRLIFNIHHIIGILAMSSGLYYKTSCGYIVWFLTIEASTPFLNIRWFLINSNYKENHPYVNIMSYLFFLSYTFVRVIQMPIIQYYFIKNYNFTNNNHFFYIENVLFALLYSMILYWYYEIISKVLKSKTN